MTEAIMTPPDAGSTAPTLAEDPALGLSQRAKMEILGAVLLGLFLGALDQTVVGTALPKIVTDLGGNDLYTWVVTIYLLTSTISVPFYGKLSDIYGRRPMLMIGITLFLVGSALSGPEPGDVAADPVPRASRAWGPAPCSRSRSPSSATSSPPPNAANTRACSGPCSGSRSSSARRSVAS